MFFYSFQLDQSTDFNERRKLRAAIREIKSQSGTTAAYTSNRQSNKQFSEEDYKGRTNRASSVHLGDETKFIWITKIHDENELNKLVGICTNCAVDLSL